MDKKFLMVATLAVLAVFMAGVAVLKSPQSSTTVTDPKTGQQTTTYGSVAGPDSPFPYSAVGGVQTWSFSQLMTQNASTTCQWQTPPATTTLSAFAYRFGLASTSAMIVEMGKSAGPNATTTLFGTTFTVAAGAQATVEASSTTGAAGDLMVLAPSTWLAVKIGAGAPGSVPTGTCNFEVQALP